MLGRRALASGADILDGGCQRAAVQGMVTVPNFNILEFSFGVELDEAVPAKRATRVGRPLAGQRSRAEGCGDARRRLVTARASH